MSIMADTSTRGVYVFDVENQWDEQSAFKTRQFKIMANSEDEAFKKLSVRERFDIGELEPVINGLVWQITDSILIKLVALVRESDFRM
jgi:hypothetical protein